MNKIFILLVVGLVCINARSLKPKKVKILQRPSNCGCPLPLTEILSPCNCQKVVIDDPSRPLCYQCVETYGVLNTEMPGYGPIPALKLLNPAKCDCSYPFGACDGNILPVATCNALPAINLPDLYETVNMPMSMSGLVADISCTCQAPMAFQYVESKCGCQNPGLVEYLAIEMPLIADPGYVQVQKCQQQIVNMPCSCQNVPCSCQNVPCSCQSVPCSCQAVTSNCQNMPCAKCQNMPCSCQTSPCTCKSMPCACQNVPCSCQSLPCSCQAVTSNCQNMPCAKCQNMPCSCQTSPCTCKSMPCACQNVPCTCQTMPCGCQSTPCSCQNLLCSCQGVPCNCLNMPCTCQTMPCSCQSSPCDCQTTPCSCKNISCTCRNVIPSLELPCSCQMPAINLPVYGFGCQSLPPPVVGCGGKYLRQVTIPPPFL